MCVRVGNDATHEMHVCVCDCVLVHTLYIHYGFFYPFKYYTNEIYDERKCGRVEMELNTIDWWHKFKYDII